MTLDDLLARTEITDLVLGRLHCLDSKDWARYGDFHTEDVVSRTWADFPADRRGADRAVVGREALVAAVRKVLGGPVHVTTVHRVQLAEFRRTTDTTAEAVWAMEDRLWWDNSGTEEYLHGWGHYVETYRHEESWLVATRSLQRTRVERSDDYFTYLQPSRSTS